MKSVNGARFDLISKYRAVLMGVAILAILFCHVDVALKHNELSVTRMGHILHIFTVGVDIFMFLSGFGLFYSCRKHNYSYPVYLKKRVVRVLPYYLIIAGITYMILKLQNSLPIERFFEDLLFISWVKRGSTRYWYVLTIIIFYAVFPPIFALLKQEGRKSVLSLLLILAVFFTAAALMDRSFSLYRRFRIAVERFPVFLLGAFCGKLATDGERINPLVLLGVIVSGFTASAMLYCSIVYSNWIERTFYMYYLTRGMLALAVLGTGILIMESLEKYANRLYSVLFRSLSFLGRITLEIYLFHQSYMLIFDFPYSPLGYLAAGVVLPLFFSVALNAVRKSGKAKA